MIPIVFATLVSSSEKDHRWSEREMETKRKVKERNISFLNVIFLTLR
jgi:hypothetical protein